jgi:hypothetical protein
MPTFLYIDYGPSPYIERELRYSLSTLLAEYPGGDAQIVVYTDKPKTYDNLHDRVRARDISGDIGAMTTSKNPLCITAGSSRRAPADTSVRWKTRSRRSRPPGPR